MNGSAQDCIAGTGEKIIKEGIGNCNPNPCGSPAVCIHYYLMDTTRYCCKELAPPPAGAPDATCAGQGEVCRGISTAKDCCHGLTCSQITVAGSQSWICRTPEDIVASPGILRRQELGAEKEITTHAPPSFTITLPVLGIKIPGLTFTDPTAKDCIDQDKYPSYEKLKANAKLLGSPGSKEYEEYMKSHSAYQCYEFKWIGEYVNAIFKFFVAIVGILATVMIMWGGIKYLTAGGNPTQISGAKDTMGSAIFGLVLAFGSVMILSAINPSLTKLSSIGPIQVIVKGEEFELGELCEELDLPNMVSPSDSIPAVDPNATCNPDEIIEKAKLFVGKNSGPCHCAYFVSTVLIQANCGISLTTSAEGLENELINKGWKKVEINKRKKGDIVCMAGHLGIAYEDGGKIIDSGTIKKGETINGCTKTAITCSNVWHGLNLNDGKRLWAGGRCVSNQTVRIRSNFFKYALHKP